MNLRTREEMIEHLKSNGYKVNTWTQEDRHSWLTERGWTWGRVDGNILYYNAQFAYGLNWEQAVQQQLKADGYVFFAGGDE